MSPLRKRMLDDMTVRGLSENTKKLYDRAVFGLVRYTRCRPDLITAQQVQDYLLYLHRDQGLCWSSCNVYMQGIRFFHRITLKRPEPYFYVPAAKKEKKLPVMLSRKQIGRLLEAAINPKHRAILVTAYGSGLRVSELVNLRIDDIDSGRMTIRISQGKGKKDRYVPLSPRLLEELRNYWRRARVKPTVWLFPGQCADGRLSRTGVARIYSDIKAKAGITSEGGIHTLRHCYATALLESGVALYSIQRHLGHTSIRSTMHYLRLAHSPGNEMISPLDLNRDESPCRN